jgi:sugar lactone lactonase YvrE
MTASRSTWLNLTLLRRLLVVPAAGLALYAERLAADARGAAPAPPQLSWGLFALAALVFVIAGWPPRALRESPGLLFGVAQRALAQPLRFWAPLGLGLVCALLAIPLFITINAAPPASPIGEPANTGAWLLWIAALLLFGAAWVVWERNTPAPPAGTLPDPPADRLPVRIEWLVMGVLLLGALGLRLFSLDNVPPGLWFDEAQNGIVAQRLLAPDAPHPTFIGDLTQMGALYFYVLGVVLKFAGTDIWPLRLLPALAGAITVPMIYLIAARLYGSRAGLAAAGVLMVSAWNITFSRFGMVSMTTVALDVAVYLCMVQALRTGRLGYYAGAGVLLGLAMQGYYVSRLVPLVLLVLLAHQLIGTRLRLLRAIRVGIVVFAVGALLAFLPVGLFAIQQPDTFSGRVSTVSVLNPEVNHGDPNVVIDNLNKHLLMFNFRGDANGRHNLPGAPMLDDLTAALFFIGLGACLLRAWRWQYAFPVVWFVAAISGGVLSIPFEAPQSHRTLENSVVTALLAGIVLGELWQCLTRTRRATEEADEAAPTRKGLSRALPWGVRARPKAPATTLPTRRRSVEAAGTLPVRPRTGAAPSPAPQPAVLAAVAESSPAHPPPADGENGTHPAETLVAGPVPAEPAEPATMTPDAGDQPLPSETPGALPDAAGAAPEVLAPVPATVRQRPSRSRLLAWAVSAVGILVVVGAVSQVTIPRYFQVQARDRSVWGDMYSPEAQAARLVRSLSPNYQVFVSSVFIGLPPMRYLVPDANPIEWPGMAALPLNGSDRDVAIIIDPPQAADLTAIARMYPHASFDPFNAPSDPSPMLYTIRIPATDIAALHGVQVSFYDPGATSPREERTTPNFALDWAAVAKPGTARLATTLHVDQYGVYNFDWHPAGAATEPALLVDGYPVRSGDPVSLAVGLHTVVATDTVGTATGTAQLGWAMKGNAAQPVPAADLFDPQRIEPHGLTGYYRQGTTAGGPPQGVRVDSVISFNFHLLPMQMARPYNVEWRGRLYVPQAGPYTLATEQISESHLYVDGQEVIVNLRENNVVEAQLTLAAGWHDLRLLFIDAAGYSHMYLYWTPPGRGRSIIPSAFLWPELGAYPTVPSTGPWPTLAESDASILPGQGTKAPPAPEAGGPTPAPVPVGVVPTPPIAAAPAPTQAPAGPVTALTPGLLLGAPGPGLARPRAAAADAAGNIYIFTEQDSKIHKFGPDGKEILAWDVRNSAGKPLIEGSALLIKDNQLRLLDAAASDLLSFDLDGKATGKTHLCACCFPRGMAVAGDGNYWLADTGNNRLIKVTPDGQSVQTLGGKGTAPGQFAEPASVWEAAGGTLYVADIGNNRVQSLAPDGKPLAAWWVGPSIARDGNRLTGDSAGNVLVTIAAQQAIARFDSHGQELQRWQFTNGGGILTPVGIAPVGADRFIALYLNNGLAAVFSTGQ